MAQWVKPRTLDFSSGHDLTVREFKPQVRLCADHLEPAWDSLFLSLPLLLALSLKINKLKKKIFLIQLLSITSVIFSQGTLGNAQRHFWWSHLGAVLLASSG